MLLLHGLALPAYRVALVGEPVWCSGPAGGAQTQLPALGCSCVVPFMHCMVEEVALLAASCAAVRPWQRGGSCCQLANGLTNVFWWRPCAGSSSSGGNNCRQLLAVRRRVGAGAAAAAKASCWRMLVSQLRLQVCWTVFILPIQVAAVDALAACAAVHRAAGGLLKPAFLLRRKSLHVH